MWILDYGDAPRKSMTFLGDTTDEGILVEAGDPNYKEEVKSPVIDRLAQLGWNLYRDKTEKS